MLSAMTGTLVSLALITMAFATLLCGYDLYSFSTLLYGMSGMYKDLAVSLFIETFVQTNQISFRGTQDISPLIKTSMFGTVM